MAAAAGSLTDRVNLYGMPVRAGHGGLRRGTAGKRALPNEKETGRGPSLAQLAERVGFEPTVPETGTPDFESGAFDHSATFPGSRAAWSPPRGGHHKGSAGPGTTRGDAGGRARYMRHGLDWRPF